MFNLEAGDKSSDSVPCPPCIFSGLQDDGANARRRNFSCRGENFIFRHAVSSDGAIVGPDAAVFALAAAEVRKF